MILLCGGQDEALTYPLKEACDDGQVMVVSRGVGLQVSGRFTDEVKSKLRSINYVQYEGIFGSQCNITAGLN